MRKLKKKSESRCLSREDIFNSVNRLLSVRPRSKFELERYIRGKTKDLNDIEFLLSKIPEDNDKEFVEYICFYRVKRLGLSIKQTQVFLMSKGVDKHTIDTYIDVDEIENIKSIIRRNSSRFKFNKAETLEGRDKNDFFKFFINRGFKNSSISSVWEEFSDRDSYKMYSEGIE